MKTVDFFYLGHFSIKTLLTGLLACYTLTAMAAPPSPKTLDPSNNLILTLSDKWLETDTRAGSEFHKSGRVSKDNLIMKQQKSRQTNIGCRMDVSPLPSTDDSLLNRVEGKCNFNYHY